MKYGQIKFSKYDFVGLTAKEAWNSLDEEDKPKYENEKQFMRYLRVKGNFDSKPTNGRVEIFRNKYIDKDALEELLSLLQGRRSALSIEIREALDAVQGTRSALKGSKSVATGYEKGTSRVREVHIDRERERFLEQDAPSSPPLGGEAAASPQPCDAVPLTSPCQEDVPLIPTCKPTRSWEEITGKKLSLKTWGTQTK